MPLLISQMQVSRAQGAVFDRIHQRMRGLSARIESEVQRLGDRLVVGVSAP